jgi:hypothetical protein
MNRQIYNYAHGIDTAAEFSSSEALSCVSLCVEAGRAAEVVVSLCKLYKLNGNDENQEFY